MRLLVIGNNYIVICSNTRKERQGQGNGYDRLYRHVSFLYTPSSLTFKDKAQHTTCNVHVYARQAQQGVKKLCGDIGSSNCATSELMLKF